MGMPQRKTRDCCVHTWCGGCARAQELRFIHKAKELQLAAAMAGQSTVQVGPKLAAAMAGQSTVQVGPARQSMSDKLKGSSDKLKGSSDKNEEVSLAELEYGPDSYEW